MLCLYAAMWPILTKLNAAIRQTVDTYGRLDIAINNAGIGGKYGRFIDQTPDDFDQIMAVNVGGVFYGMQAQIRQMLLQQKRTKAVANGSRARSCGESPGRGPHCECSQYCGCSWHAHGGALQCIETCCNWVDQNSCAWSTSGRISVSMPFARLIHIRLWSMNLLIRHPLWKNGCAV